MRSPTPLGALLGGVIALALASGCARGESEADASSSPPAAEAPKAAEAPEGNPPAEPSKPVAAGDLRLVDAAIEPPPPGGSTYRVDAYVAAAVVAHLQVDPLPFVPWRSDGSEPAQPRAGYRLGPIAAEGLWARLGLREGDIVHEINGVSVATDVWATEAIELGGNRVTATVYRDDLSLVLSYRLMGGQAWFSLAQDPAAEPPAEVDSPRHGGEIPAPIPTEPAPGEAVPSVTPPSVAKPGGAKPVPKPSGSKPGGAKPVPKPSGSKPAARCTSASRCSIDKSLFDSLVRSPSKLDSQARVVPAIRNDVHSGYKLKSVRPGSAVAQLGFRAGDKITHINGRDLTNELEAMQLYMGLSGTRRFRVRYERGGSARTKTIDVVG